MNPEDYNYTDKHVWIYLETKGVGKIGITDYAQDKLGEIVFVELPASGTEFEQSQKMGEIEAQKTVSDFFSPMSGRVVEINKSAYDEPKLINEDPYGTGWLVRMEFSNPMELDDLMSRSAYEQFISESG
jgi:glycine cleavage system H protein